MNKDDYVYVLAVFGPDIFIKGFVTKQFYKNYKRGIFSKTVSFYGLENGELKSEEVAIGTTEHIRYLMLQPEE